MTNNNNNMEKHQPKFISRSLFFLIGLSLGFIICLNLKHFSPTFINLNIGTSNHTSASSSSIDNIVNVELFEREEGNETLSMHDMSDEELFERASMVEKSLIFDEQKKIAKVAFMFLTKGPLPLAPLWEKFFEGHYGYYSIYVHPHPSYREDHEFRNTSVFYGRRIPSQPVSWGSSSMIDATRRLLGNALLDISNQRFILLSESCIPLFNFTYTYNFFITSNQSFVGSFDNPRKDSRGRYNPQMSPQINITDWRKGSQWFEANRKLANIIIKDTTYYPIFVKHCRPPCYNDEHYIPTLVHMLSPELNTNRAVTWVDWSRGGAHPGKFGWENVTDEFLNQIRFGFGFGSGCDYKGDDNSSTCFLFARKFVPSSLEQLLRVAPLILGHDP